MPGSDDSTDSGVERRLKYDSSGSDAFISDSDEDSKPKLRKGKSDSTAPEKKGNREETDWKIDSEDSDAENVIQDEKPLQLVRFVKGDKGKITMTIVSETQDKVLKSVGELPLCPIILIGPPGQGKSFLGNFLIRRLESMEEEQPNWMGWSDKRQPLTGFPWRTAEKLKSSQEDGLYIWHRPFTIDSDEGKVAVLLLECNGFQDELLGSQKAQTSIFGLSFLMSSMLIYTANASFISKDNFPKGLFLPWIPFTKFGAKIRNEDGEKLPFQTFSFLIRDWENSAKYSFGAKDGKKFLTEQMKTLNDDRATKYAQSFTKSFSTHDCFLLPPANESFSEESFDGSLEKIPTDFAKKLEKYVGSLISESSVPMKKIGNGTMTGYEFKLFLSSYLDLFNLYLQGREKLDGNTLYSTTARIFNESVIGKSISKYEAVFERDQKGVPYLVEDLQQVTHNNAIEKAEMVFKKSPMKAGDKPVFKRQLTSEMKKAFARIQEENEKRRIHFVSECLQEACRQYKDGLHKEIVFENEVTFFEESEIREIGNQLVSKITEEFMINFEGESKENLVKLNEGLGQKLNPILESILYRNNQNRRQAEGIMDSVIENLLKRYKLEMNGCIAEEAAIPTQILEAYHKVFRKIIIRKFGKRDLPGTKSFQLPYSNQLSELMEDAFMAYANGEQSKIEVKQEQATSLMNKLKNQHQSQLQEFLSNTDMVSEEELRSFHMGTAAEIMEVFHQKNPFNAGNILGDKLTKKLEDELESEFEAVLKREIQAKQKISETCENAKAVSLQQYIEDMEAAKYDVGFIDADELVPTHERSLGRALGNYDQLTGDLEDEGPVVDQRQELKHRIQEAYEKFRTTNILSQEGAESAAKLLMRDFKTMYIETMSVDNLKTADELREEHQRKLNDTVETFSELLGRKSNAFKNKCVNKLVTTLDKKFADFKIKFELKVASEEVEFKKVVQAARQYYHEQMEKECKNLQLITINMLEALHLKISNDAITHGFKDYEVTDEQYQQLMESMEESFIKYKMEYTMYSSGETEDIAIGIDLGTTYCCVAVLQNKEVKIISNQDGEETTPSYVAFTRDLYGSLDHVIGQTAKDDAYSNPENTIFDAKRIIGRKMNEEVLKSDMKFWPFQVIEDKGVPKIEIYEELYAPEQVSAILLSKLKSQVEEKLGQKVKKAVITVPAYFSDGQRSATRDAGQIAGFEVLTILNEPTAAAIAYKVKQFAESARKVLVFDLGGGTFDVALLTTDCNSIAVLGVAGDTHLGGEDFDRNLMQFCVKEFKKESGIDLLADKDSLDKPKKDNARRTLRRLQTYCEKAKRALTAARQTKISVDNMASGIDLHVTVTREKFEQLNMRLFRKTIEVVDNVLKTAKVSREEVKDIVLIGGSTKIPKVKEMLSKHFNNRALNHSVNPDVAVAYGTAVQAALLNGPEGKRLFNFESIRDVTPMSLGIESRINGVDDDIPPGEAGEQEVEVHMHVDHMGIIHVKAVCKSTNGSNEITVKEDKGRLTEAEKTQMKAKIAKPVKRPKNIN
ncbi:Heat shock 70 kDa protein cognate 4 [Orchesella cincta]|uniref:Heat shock 70 kDa protein cognate 4 n=1 Tax=Orchesella cincta TaxID=48709 RepID=A0A1D2MFV5_ORCCI|nr:Heat shock 70 kDa protein cognate 4 [Orchesella cincta]